jgi:hypothetical protein
VSLGLEVWVSAWRWWSRADLSLEAWVSAWRWWSSVDLGLEGERKCRRKRNVIIKKE